MATKKTNKHTTPLKEPTKETVEISDALPEKTTQKQGEPKGKKSAEKKSLNIFLIVILLLIAAGIYLYQKGYITQHYPIAKSKFSHHSPLNGEDAFTKLQKETQGLTPPDPTPKSEKAESPPRSPLINNSELKEQVETLNQTVQNLKSELIGLRTAHIKAQENERKNVISSTDPKEIEQNLILKIKQISAWRDLKLKINHGAPYGGEIESLCKALGGRLPSEIENLLQKLASFSSIGIPSLRILYKYFKPMAHDMDQKEAFSNAETPLDKAKAFFKQFVTIQKKNDMEMGVSNVKTPGQTLLWKIKQGHISAVILDIETLKSLNINEPKLAKWLLQAKTYQGSQGILNTLRNHILD